MVHYVHRLILSSVFFLKMEELIHKLTTQCPDATRTNRASNEALGDTLGKTLDYNIHDSEFNSSLSPVSCSIRKFRLEIP